MNAEVENDEVEDSDEPLESTKKSRPTTKERKSVDTNDGQEGMDKAFNDNDDDDLQNTKSTQNLLNKGVTFGKQIKPTTKEVRKKYKT